MHYAVALIILLIPLLFLFCFSLEGNAWPRTAIGISSKRNLYGRLKIMKIYFHLSHNQDTYIIITFKCELNNSSPKMVVIYCSRLSYVIATSIDSIVVAFGRLSSSFYLLFINAWCTIHQRSPTLFLRAFFQKVLFPRWFLTKKIIWNGKSHWK